MRADAVYPRGTRPSRSTRSTRSTRSAGPATSSRQRPPSSTTRRRPVNAQTPFRRLARTHALMSIGDVAMFASLAGSVLGLDPDGQRTAVLQFLLVSFAPFVVLAPLIGPTIDRIPGGRRVVIQGTAVVRAALYVMMAFHTDDVVLYPLLFIALVMQKTYAVSKIAVVPLVVRNAEELVEANSKLGLISALAGAVAFAPLAGIGHLSAAAGLVLGALIFVFAALAGGKLPREAVATSPVADAERVELRSDRIVLAAGAMVLIRASIGFLFFHLLFWLKEDYGLAQFGLAAAASTIGSMAGNVAAPHLRRAAREETMQIIALGVIAVAGVGAAVTGGLFTAVFLALVCNFSSSIGRMAFDSIVQRDAPDANQGRAFAQFETRFQLGWVIAALVPVAFTLPGQLGFLVVGLIGATASATYLLGWRAMKAGKPLPMSLTQRAKREISRRRGNTPPAGQRRPAPRTITPDPRERRKAADDKPLYPGPPGKPGKAGKRPKG